MAKIMKTTTGQEIKTNDHTSDLVNECFASARVEALQEDFPQMKLLSVLRRRHGRAAAARFTQRL